MRAVRPLFCNHLIVLFASLVFVLSSFAQQPQAPPQQPTPQPADPQKSLADYAREARGEKAAVQPNGTQSSKSLSELASEKRANRKLEVKLTEKQAGELLTELDNI